MKLQEWRQRGTCETLPSGLEVRLVDVTLLDLAMAGQIPAPLAGIVNEMIEGKDVTISIDSFEKMAPLINGMAKLAIADPPVADEPDEDHLGVEELPAMDRLWLFNKLNEGQQLEKFRAEAGEPVDAAQPGDGVREAAERNTGVGAGDVGGVPGGPGDADGGPVGGAEAGEGGDD